MQGLHLTADLYDCRCPAPLLTDSNLLADLCRRAVKQASLTLVDEQYVQFPEHEGQPGGVTGAVLLAESHLAVHSWPERRSVTLDVYVCNFSTDNTAKAERALDTLLAAFEPGSRVVERIVRGLGGPASATVQAPTQAVDDPGSLLLEWLNIDSAYGFRSGRRIESVQTPYQQLDVFDTPQWGRMLRLDGSFMTSERDEFFYHETIIHPACVAHPGPSCALVIGGGDGGSTEELLKHPSMQRVIIAELDAEVIRIARAHLQTVHCGALDDPRVDIRIGDGWTTAESLARTPTERFDLIVLDLTDPDTPAHRLYSREFFDLARQLLKPGGALTLHIGSPVYKPDSVRRLIGELRSSFPIVRPLGVHIPLYGAYWGMAVASDTLDPLATPPTEIAQRIAARGIGDLRYYNEQVHAALFALPNFFRDLLT